MGAKKLWLSAKTYLKILAYYRFKRETLPYLPVLYWIESTNRCNLKCRMCINAQLPDKMGSNMETETFFRLVDEIAAEHPADVATIALFLGGEPFLHPQLFEMIRYARTKNIKVNLATNGTLLTGKNIDLLLENPPSLLILSFDGYNRESYENARVGASFEKVQANIIDFLKEKKIRGLSEPLVRMYSLILDPANEVLERKRFEDFFQNNFKMHGVDEFLIENAGGTSSWLSEDCDHAAAAPPVQKEGKKLPCIRLWYTMSILSDGTVVPCCTDFTGRVKLGNIKEKTLREIWNGAPFRAFRRRMIEGHSGEIPLCAGCGVLSSTDATLGFPGEILIHRMMVRNLLSRLRAMHLGRKVE